jgi:hypothetical protein
MNEMDNPPPVFGNSDAVAIVDVLKTFVSIHQKLLNTIIGKHGLLSRTSLLRTVAVYRLVLISNLQSSSSPSLSV